MTDLEQNHLFERLVRPHFDRLYRLAWRLTGNRAEAEDLFQELLIKSYGKLGQLVEIDEPGSWLCRMMYNLFVDQYRRFTRQRMHLVDEGHLPGEGLAGIAGELDPLDDPERIDRIRRLDAALAALSDDHRIIVLLHDTEGYTLSEISKLVGAPEGTIKSRLHRARARLRQILSEDGTI
jgi:RNA polymerase sigma-70 factor (ECF subfamily)